MTAKKVYIKPGFLKEGDNWEVWDYDDFWGLDIILKKPDFIEDVHVRFGFGPGYDQIPEPVEGEL